MEFSGGDNLDLHDFMNVQRVFRTLAAEWGCPVWAVKRTIRRIIDQNWERAMSDPEAKAMWDAYFPTGKPTPDQYILRLGNAHENGEDMPFFINRSQ